LLNDAAPLVRLTGEPRAVPPSENLTVPLAVYPELVEGERSEVRTTGWPGTAETGIAASPRVVGNGLPARLMGLEVLGEAFASPA